MERLVGLSPLGSSPLPACPDPGSLPTRASQPWSYFSHGCLAGDGGWGQVGSERLVKEMLALCCQKDFSPKPFHSFR